MSFMPTKASTSGRLNSEFIRLSFLQVHRETDLFFAASGVQLAQFDIKSRVGNILTKGAPLRITLNLDGASPPNNPVYVSRVNFLASVCSISSHRHSYISLIFRSRLSIHNKLKKNGSLKKKNQSEGGKTNRIGGGNKCPSPESNSAVDDGSEPKKSRDKRHVFTPLEKEILVQR